MNYINCIDASTDYCPCKLSEVNECLICSQLKGKSFCDCINYSGTCIYQEYVWSSKKSKPLREYNVYKINDRKFIREDILVLSIKLNNHLCRELCNIGAFIFLKSPEDDDIMGLPISVVNSNIEDETITVYIKKEGIKSKKIFDIEKNIAIKAPYWNGIQGQSNLRNLKNDNCLIIGRGIALAPMVMAAQKLSEKGNKITAMLDPGRNSESYFSDLFKQINCEVINTFLFNDCKNLSEGSKERLLDIIKNNNISVVLSAGNDKFHREIISYLYKANKDIKFATVNNSIMCCGDGICGSCIVEENGKSIRTCKQQYNPLSIFGGGTY